MKQFPQVVVVCWSLALFACSTGEESALARRKDAVEELAPQAQVYTAQVDFEGATRATAVAFPPSADTALPYKPVGTGLRDYSCIQQATGVRLPWGSPTPFIHVQAPLANVWLCFIGPGWNAGPSNTNPTPRGPTLGVNGEDDYLLTFSEPVSAVGFELLTNQAATETITLTYEDSTSDTFTDAVLATAANRFEFVGFKASKPIRSVLVNTLGGGSQNEGISAIWTAPANALPPPPNLVLTSPTEGHRCSPDSGAPEATTGTVRFTGDTGTTLSTVIVSVDGVEVERFQLSGGGGGWSRSYPLGVGEHVVRFTATNAAGTSTRAVSVGVVPNAPVLVSSPTAPINGAQPTVGWELRTFPGAEVDVTVEDLGGSTGAQPAGTSSAGAEGRVTVALPRPSADCHCRYRFSPRVRGQTLRGPSASGDVYVDTQPPAIVSLDGVDGPWGTGPTVLTAVANDSHSPVPGNTLGYTWRVEGPDGTGPSVPGGPVFSQPFGPGAYTVHVTVTDTAGNVSTRSTPVIIRPHTTTCSLPDVRVPYGAPLHVSGTLVDTTVGAPLGAEWQARLRYQVDGQPVDNLEGYPALLSPGAHTLEVLFDGARHYAPSQGRSTLTVATWAMARSLRCARILHTATLLADGRVLVTGGFIPLTELYEPATGQWLRGGDSRTNHRYHTATLLPEGRVLVAGGEGASASASAEVYDVASHTWQTTGNLLTYRSRHAAVLLPGGKVLVTGGVNARGGRLASAEVYDMATGQWSATGSMTEARAHHTATLLPDGRVLVVGGEHSGCRQATAEVYDVATGSWTRVGSMTEARGHHTATLLPGGRVLVTGGAEDGDPATTAEVYDMATGRWSATGRMGQPRRHHTATLLPSGHVLVTGGYDDYTGIHTSAEVYDVATGTWSPTRSLAVERYSHTATLLRDGRVLVAGGLSSGDQASAELLQ